MSDPRTNSAEHRPVEAAPGAAHGRHRGPASDDASPADFSGHGRHRRPPAESLPSN
jgi:hypothetical protein